jgi:hypothetical protein
VASEPKLIQSKVVCRLELRSLIMKYATATRDLSFITRSIAASSALTPRFRDVGELHTRQRFKLTIS